MKVEGDSIWVENVRVGHLAADIQSVMAKEEILNSMFKGNSLFSLLCAGVVHEDDLIWNQKMICSNTYAGFIFAVFLCKNKYAYVFHLHPYISEDRKDRSFKFWSIIFSFISFLIVYVDWENIICYSVQTSWNFTMVWGRLHVTGMY